MSTLRETLGAWSRGARARAGELAAAGAVEQVGRVERVADGVAFVSGLPDARLDEVLRLGAGVPALASELGRDAVGCVLLGEDSGVWAGAPALGTGEVVRAPVGDALLGRVVDPLGRPLDGRPAPEPSGWEPADRPGPELADRAPVTRPLLTGVLAVDAMFPVGRGQRELVVGDRATGKSALALDAVVRQRDTGVLCVYAAIGQKSSAVADAVAAVRQRGAPDATCFVVAGPGDPPGLQWLAPFAAFTLAEHFAARGRDVLVVLDDLTRHAALHRQLALLLRQPVGREAYPGDVFHLHARLLERATQLCEEKGGGSITALPVAETQGGDLAGYIPTNLISICDGQLVLDGRLFAEGQRPAVDVGRSISRVGGKAQPPALRALAEGMRLDYAQFVELEVFTRFGALADERTRRAVERGRRARALLCQPRLAPRSLATEVTALLGLAQGALDALPLDRVARFAEDLARFVARRAPAEAQAVEQGGPLDASREQLAAAARELAGALLPEPGRG